MEKLPNLIRRTCCFAVLLLAILQVPTVKAQYLIKEAYPNLLFNNQVEAVAASDGKRLYVVEQAGIIRWLSTESATTEETILFLDISDRVVSGGERGLLGLAFHPDFEQNGYFYVNYTTGNPLKTRVSRFTATANAPVDPATELVIITYDQPFSNHNGGKITFGPDGYLYISAGDGGSGGDPQNNAQNRKSLLGKILRIDVDAAGTGRPYAIPETNPFAHNTAGYREEIYAYGLRNAWKFSFDQPTGRLIAGDVGQNSREEIDLIQNGGNYGWRIMEGSACYNPANNCDKEGLILPIYDYTHASGAGRSITGGFVYRGKQMPELQGKYIYGDYVSGNIWALALNADGTAADNTLLLNTDFLISAFAEDENNELLVLSYGNGRKIYRLTSSEVTKLKEEVEAAIEVYPNPASGNIQIRLDPKYKSNSQHEISMYNMRGQVVLKKKIRGDATEDVLETSGLPKGVYELHIKTQAGSLCKKVVLQ